MRKIPSTVQRCRISKSQNNILQLEFNNHCLNLEQNKQIDDYYLMNIFGNSNNLILDIGFGNGDQLLELSTKNPQYNFIGIELYQKGIANLITNIKKNSITNIKIIYGDAIETLKNYFADNIIYKLQIFFPDPWPKLRHHKRRLINHGFMEIIKSKLLANGIVHIATDSDDYAKHINKIIQGFSDAFHELNQHDLFRPVTKFEKIGLSLGNKIYDLVFTLQTNKL